MESRNHYLLLGAFVALPVALHAQDLSKEAKITEPAARRTALAAVPGGKVDDFELEREGGKLIYSYDIKVAGKSGIEEVHIDAITGKLLAKEHEDAAAEAKESADEADEAGQTKEAGEGAAGMAALKREAKITEPAARRTALAAVPGGKVDDFELEREGGKLIYSYDIKVAGKSGIEEVHIDAITGKLLAKEHEDAAAEAKATGHLRGRGQ